MLNALLYITTTGCKCRLPPKDFPQCSGVRRHFYQGREIFAYASTIVS
ncbi:hypothetical protein EHI42_28815 [Rhizobium hidalgonense]|nr:hypothetical protein EHI42_28815 [Rhizobium hidalgonense]